MSKTLNVGYTDTVATPKNLPVPDLSYGVDFRVKSETANEVVITNVTSPIDRPEQLRFGYSEIKDVYANTSVDPSVYSNSRKGVQILCQVTDVYSVSDTVDATYRVDLPVSCHVVVKIPACELITPDQIKALVFRSVSGMFETGQVTSARLNSMFRGSLTPTAL